MEKKQHGGHAVRQNTKTPLLFVFLRSIETLTEHVGKHYAAEELKSVYIRYLKGEKQHIIFRAEPLKDEVEKDLMVDMSAFLDKASP